MCFYIHPAHPKKLTARKDIVCYKVLEKNPETSRWYAPYRNYEYRYNKLKKSEIKKTLWGGKIDVGLHSFSSLKAAQDSNVFLMGYNREMFEAVIPKGSKYYHNPSNGEYVSNQLMIVKRLK